MPDQFATNVGATSSVDRLARAVGGVANSEGSFPVDSGTGWANSVRASAIGTTATDGAVLANTTAATATGTVQYSTRLRLRGSAWNTTTHASNTHDWWVDVRPASGNPTTSILTLQTSNNGAAPTTPFQLTNTGAMYALSVSLTTYVLWGATNAFMDVDYSSGLGYCHTWSVNAGAYPILLLNKGITDLANKYAVSSCWKPAIAGPATNEATVRIHSFAVSYTGNTYLEKGSFRANGDLHWGVGTSGEDMNFGQVNELTTIAAAPFTDTTIQIPAGAKVLAVTGRVTVQPGGTVTMDVGIAGATTRFATGVSTVAATTFLGQDDIHLTVYTAAVSIRYTPNALPSDAAGRVKTRVFYFLPTAPTS